MEDLLARHLEENGIPFQRQFKYVPGRRFAADFGIPEHKILVEVQGGVYTRKAHGSITGVLRDNFRLNQATLAGWRVLRVTPDEVADGRAIDLIAAVMEKQCAS